MNTYELDKNIYSKNVLLRTAYSFLSEYYVHLDSKQDKWIVFLKQKDSNKIKNLEQMNGEFENALINESFRDSLIEKTRTVKEIIIARALFGADDYNVASQINSSASAPDYSDLDAAVDNYIDDPLGIAIPWEEKYGKENKSFEKDK